MSKSKEDPGPIKNFSNRVTRETAQIIIDAVRDVNEQAEKLRAKLVFIDTTPVHIQGHLGCVSHINSVRVYLSRLNSLISNMEREIERRK